MNVLNSNCTIYVVRHGETINNRLNRLQGQSDSPLTDEGIKSSIVLGKKLKSIHFDASFSSDIMRAVDTAKLILLKRKITLTTTKLLRERSYGIYEGKTYDEYNKELKIDFEALKKMTITKRQKYKPHKDVENDSEIASRFFTFIREISLAYANKTVLVVSHGGIMRSSLIHLGVGNYNTLPMGAIRNNSFFVLESDGAEINVISMENIHFAKNKMP